MVHKTLHSSFGKLRIHILFLALFIFVFGAASTFAVVPYDIIKGNLADTTPWAIVKPQANWNGTIILDIDGN